MAKVYQCVDGKMILIKVLEDIPREQVLLENCKKCKRYREDENGNQIPCENKQREHIIYPIFECYIGEDYEFSYALPVDYKGKNKPYWDR